MIEHLERDGKATVHFFGMDTLENYLFPIEALGANFEAQPEYEYLLQFRENQLIGVLCTEERVDTSDLVVAIDTRLDDGPDAGGGILAKPPP